MFSLADHPCSTNLGAVKRGKKPLVINDINEELVDTYTAMRDDVDALIAELTARSAATAESDYYAARDNWTPSSLVERAARMIYLNRLAFNGLYRVNSSGRFNVPFGKVANPVVCNEELLRANSSWLHRVHIRRGSFMSAVNDAQEGDLVYLDPPYIPLSPTASFSKYAQDDFREMDQWALKGVIDGLIARGVHVVLSNSNTELTRQVFSNLDLYVVSAARSISAAGASRSRVEEVLGLSFPASSASNPAELARLHLYPRK